MTIKVNEPPKCSHCDETMVRYELPPISFSDGLGWGTTFLWVCPSDECPIFRKGYGHNINNYGNTASLRSIVEPDTGRASVVPAMSMDDEHFKDFVDLRKKQMKKFRDEGFTETRDTEDYMDNPYDPNLDFTEK
jgi:hypothetical protein